MDFLEGFQPVWFSMPRKDPKPQYTRKTYRQGYNDAMKKLGKWNGFGDEYGRGYVKGSDDKWDVRKKSVLQG